MYKVLLAVLITALMSGLAGGLRPVEKEEELKGVARVEASVVVTPVEPEEPLETLDPITEEEVPEEFPISQEDIELIALVTMAEAEGESEYGKRLVIDTILNRMDSEYWPDTASEVIYQEDQFTSVWNGRIDRCYVRNDICQLVKEELVNRSNYDVVFFRTKYFSPYGQPLFQEGNHYFSSILY